MNPFDDLERQLRRSVRGRRARSRVLRHGVVLAGAGALLTGAGATAALVAGGRGDDPTGHRLAYSVIRATETLAALGIFRRAPGRDDRVQERWLRAGLGGSEGVLLARSVRGVRVGGGLRLIVFITRGDVGMALRDPAACLALRHREVDRRGAGSDVADLRAAHAELDELERERQARVADQSDQLFLFAERSPGVASGGGGAVIEDVLARGMGGWTLDRRRGRRYRILHGLVPDRVAAVELRTTFHGRPYRRRVKIRDNVYGFRIPYGGPFRLIWRDANGKRLPRG
jgi:hypothetical protein